MPAQHVIKGCTVVRNFAVRLAAKDRGLQVHRVLLAGRRHKRNSGDSWEQYEGHLHAGHSHLFRPHSHSVDEHRAAVGHSLRISDDERS